MVAASVVARVAAKVAATVAVMVGYRFEEFRFFCPAPFKVLRLLRKTFFLRDLNDYKQINIIILTIASSLYNYIIMQLFYHKLNTP